MNGNVWAYRRTSGFRPGMDLTGYKVEATEGPIGKVDKHSDEVGSSYLVVDTGVWIFGKEVLLPVRAITKVDEDARRIYVDLTKSEIKDAPEFDREKHLGAADYRSELSTYYGFGASFARRPAA
ncbi:PRC-barrel domain-containing protein [Streptomyces sp. NPDC002138]|uniref:PRC-barrel domain-containing protein n=1 Tax=Streptomyces sp. NPDC002138 TaxID=3154410 RepID=UPI003326116E